MKKFLLALGVIAMTFSVAACGDDNGGKNSGGNNGGSNNGGSNDNGGSTSLDSAISKTCKKIANCSGGEVSESECKHEFNPNEIPAECNSKAVVWLNCLSNSDCKNFADEENCEDEAEDFADCAGFDEFGDEDENENGGIDF